jgi:hypothetical protein
VTVAITAKRKWVILILSYPHHCSNETTDIRKIKSGNVVVEEPPLNPSVAILKPILD